MRMTQPPPFRWGVNVGLCLPRRTCATRLASRPSGCPAASTTYQRRVMSSFLSENVRMLHSQKKTWRCDSREEYQRRKALSTRSFRAREGYERRPLFDRSEEHTSELQSQSNLVCRLLLEKKK